MDWLRKANNAWQWVGDKAKSVSKWVGDNKSTIKSYADRVAQYAPTLGAGIGGAVGVINPAIGGAIAGLGAGLGKGAEYIRDKIDLADSTLKKGIGYYDKADKMKRDAEKTVSNIKKNPIGYIKDNLTEDNIQRIKKDLTKGKEYIDKTKLLNFS